jgi:hypothetical protein
MLELHSIRELEMSKYEGTDCASGKVFKPSSWRAWRAAAPPPAGDRAQLATCSALHCGPPAVAVKPNQRVQNLVRSHLPCCAAHNCRRLWSRGVGFCVHAPQLEEHALLRRDAFLEVQHLNHQHTPNALTLHTNVTNLNAKAR